jgi:hypothetical protein
MDVHHDRDFFDDQGIIDLAKVIRLPHIEALRAETDS